MESKEQNKEEKTEMTHRYREQLMVTRWEEEGAEFKS